MAQKHSPSWEYPSQLINDNESDPYSYPAIPSLATTLNNSFFQHEFQYPHLNFQIESSRTQSPATSYETDYASVEWRRNDSNDRCMEFNELNYRALKRLIEEGKLSETQLIFGLTKNHLHELMVDPFGNLFVQSLIQICDESFINHLLLSLIRKECLFLAVCLHHLGHQAVVKLIDCLRRRDQQSIIALVISRHAVTLAKSFDSGHVVLKCCFRSLSQQANELIFLRIAQGCLELARDQAGCCILQPCIKYATRELREVLVTPLIQDAEHLSRHLYGNYAIQFVIKLDGGNIGARIIKVLKNKFVELSRNKYGSNVVEQCLASCEGDVNGIIFEIMKDDNWIRVCTDEYGNYVVQKIISVAKGRVCKLLVKAIENSWLVLQFHPYGKNVIYAAKRAFKKFK